MTEVIRPATSFDGESHTYYDADGNKLPGISTVAKIGEALLAFGIGSKWGWKLGYQGALEAFTVGYTLGAPQDVSAEELRSGLIDRELAPWQQRDQAGARGSWVHDILETLADGYAADQAFDRVIDQLDGERKGHAIGLLNWYLDYRPEFVATEVQVVSQEHGFAGRYDIRCWIRSDLFGGGEHTQALCLVDLKTSKDIYPLSHYAQLEGYELASTEMGFPATDLRLVLNTKPDGTYKVGVSHATSDTFLSYLGAYRAIKWMEANDPEKIRKRELEERLLAALPAKSRDLAEGFDMTPQEIGRIFGGLKKRGRCYQETDSTWHPSATKQPLSDD